MCGVLSLSLQVHDCRTPWINAQHASVARSSISQPPSFSQTQTLLTISLLASSLGHLASSLGHEVLPGCLQKNRQRRLSPRTSFPVDPKADAEEGLPHANVYGADDKSRWAVGPVLCNGQSGPVVTEVGKTPGTASLSLCVCACGGGGVLCGPAEPRNCWCND